MSMGHFSPKELKIFNVYLKKMERCVFILMMWKESSASVTTPALTQLTMAAVLRSGPGRAA